MDDTAGSNNNGSTNRGADLASIPTAATASRPQATASPRASQHECMPLGTEIGSTLDFGSAQEIKVTNDSFYGTATPSVARPKN